MADHEIKIISQPPELPSEILFFHILPRLPAKSVFRFHCVSKQWKSFLKTPTFSDLHRHHHNRHKVLFMSSTPPYTFRTIDCESPEDGLSAARSLPFKAKHENIKILSSFNGLLCVGIKLDTQEYCSDLILWNPLTGEYKPLSGTNSDEKCYESTGLALELYYNRSEDDYKVLRVTYDCDVYIYSLKSDSWRKVNDHNIHIRDPHVFSVGWLPSVVLNEKLYFLRRMMNIRTSVLSYSIITFDMKTEKFSEIATPSFENRRTLLLNIMVVRECIHFCILNRFPVIEMWRMDGEGEVDWRKVKTYFEIPSFPWFPWFQDPLHVMKNGDWLLFAKKKEKGYVYKLDLETHTKQALFSFIGMCFPYGVKYIETFVSLY